jgi:hypothetical protein
VGQWQKVETLVRAGHDFAGRQSWEFGDFPDTIAEAREFIARNLAIVAARRQVEVERKVGNAEADERRKQRRLAGLQRRKQRRLATLQRAIFGTQTTVTKPKE